MLVCVEVYQLHLSCFQRYQEAQEKCRCIIFTIRTPDIPPTEPTVYQFGHPTPPCLENHRAPHCPAWRLRGSFCGVCFSDKRLTVRIYEYVLLVNTSMPGFTSKVDPPPSFEICYDMRLRGRQLLGSRRSSGSLRCSNDYISYIRAGFYQYHVTLRASSWSHAGPLCTYGRRL